MTTHSNYDPKRHYTTRQAAEAWGVTRQRVEQLLRAGRVTGAFLTTETTMTFWCIPKNATVEPSRRMWEKLST